MIIYSMELFNCVVYVQVNNLNSQLRCFFYQIDSYMEGLFNNKIIVIYNYYKVYVDGMDIYVLKFNFFMLCEI